MSDMNDMALIQEYADRDSEPAFASLVHRHIHLVYSVAFRYVGNEPDAQDVTQAVFLILAKKAASLRQRTTLTGWLYETTRFAAAALLRTKVRQQNREQEAYMQSTLNDSGPNELWRQIAPILEEAMNHRSEKERALLALRFFDNKTAAETAALLGIREGAAHKRAARALSKLRRFFFKRGIDSTTAMIAGAISANSIQAAPVALAKAVTAVAAAKGAAVSGSTLILVKGALQLMAWTKTKMAIVMGTAAVLAAGTTAAVWNLRSENWLKAPPTLILRPTEFSRGGGAVFGADQKVIARHETLDTVIMAAYGFQPHRLILPKDLMVPGPNGPKLYDVMLTLTNHPQEALQEEIKKQLGLVAKREIRETDVMLLKVKNPNAAGLRVSERKDDKGFTPYSSGKLFFTNQPISALVMALDGMVDGKPVLDRTGLTNRYTFVFPWKVEGRQRESFIKNELQDNLANQLGLELVPSREPIEMLVVEKAQ